MNNIFGQLFKYGFHDTEISSIKDEKLKIVLDFDEGIYLLDENGKETCLSTPKQVVFKINSFYNSLEESIEIKELGKKIKHVNYLNLKKCMQEEPFKILMVYYSNFCNCILFDGGINGKRFLFSIEGVDEITVQEKNNNI